MPTLSARADIALRVCVCSAAASLFSEAIWPTGHATHPAHPPPVAAAVGSALMLSLLFVCVWDPIKERTARWMLRAPHGHGEPIGLPALGIMVVLGAALVWVHTILHHYFEAQFGDAIAAGLERGLIVLIVCAFWFSAPDAVWLRAILAVILVGVIVSLGQVLMRAGLTQAPWTQSEIVWTATSCLVLLWAERRFRPWDATSSQRAGRFVLGTGLVIVALTGLAHLVDRIVPLPSLLLYSGNAEDARDWAGTMLDNLFFYGGWAGGLLIAPDISQES